MVSVYFVSDNTGDSSLSTSPWGQGGGENGVSFAQVTMDQPYCKICMSGKGCTYLSEQF